MRALGGELGGTLPFAPPVLRVGDRVVSHVANILQVIAPRLGLVPDDEASRATAHGLQLTLTDFVAEIHDTHHPVSTALYYEDQREEARARSKAFRDARLPKFLGYFEKVLERNEASSGAWLVGRAATYVDLSMFHVLEGLDYAFPKALARVLSPLGRLGALRARVRARPRIAAYLASDRRMPFNEHGLFRRYPELDDD
jgi:glutathione S-transferase